MRKTDNEIDDWFCIRTKPIFCFDCDASFDHVHDSHRIVVWPEKDDKNMLKIAMKVKKKIGDAKIEPYQKSYGACISYYDVN